VIGNIVPPHKMEVSGQLHTPAVLLPRKEPTVLIGSVWMLWNREKFLAPAGDRTPHNEVFHSIYLYSSPNDEVKWDEISRACSTHGRRGMHIEFWWECQKERGH
jgi:hypothetical protein